MLLERSRAAAVGDFDEDGTPDIPAAVPEAPQVLILFGNGDGTFTEPVRIGLAVEPLFVTAADFDGDGHIDLATGNGNQTSVYLFLGVGDGGFQSPQLYRTATFATRLVPGDFRAGAGLDSGGQRPDLLVNAELGVTVPAAVGVCIAGSAVFEVQASGYGAVTYQWRRDGVSLVDGGAVTGSQTAVLKITPAGLANAGSYDVVVTDCARR